MKKQILSLIIGLVAIMSIHAQVSEAKNALDHADKHFFIENKGQWPDEVLYLTRIGGLDAWITKNGVLYDFYKLQEVPGSAKKEEALPDKFGHKDYTKFGHKVWYKLQGNNSLIQTEGKEKQAGYYNYLIGNDPGKYASNVGLYKEALIKNVYDGIDVRYYFDKGNIRYDYVVHPGADPSQIAFVLEGTDKTFLNPEGDLVFNTRFGEIALAELQTYQGTKANKVASSFVKTVNGWRIALGNYNREQTLIIDPLIYSTYLGGSGDDMGSSIAIDASGNAYVTGSTHSADYDITSGAYKTSHTGGYYDIFVTKLNPTGTALVYSTFLGGSKEDYAYSIAIDASGNAYVTGKTSSTNYDITSGAYKTSNAGGYWDVFVTKLNATGTALVYSTYLGGNTEEEGQSISIDASGNAYVTGYTNSNDYVTTSGAYQTSLEGNWDVFVTKLNNTGTALVYSTYLGGNNEDHGYSIAVDAYGDAYVTGYTQSTNYDITQGAYQTSLAGPAGGDLDVFVTKLNMAGTGLVYSTYLGGSDIESGYSIAIDASGNAYVTGITRSTNYDITSRAYQKSHAGGNNDIFVTKLDTSGTALDYSTYLGGSDYDYGNSIAIDKSGNAYITGYTRSTNYDTTSGAYQTRNAGNWDVFVTKLNTYGTGLLYSTYLGGSVYDYGWSIAIDVSGNVYVTGSTQSYNYDITSGAYQTSYAGGGDVFITRICVVAKATINLSSSTGTDSQSLCINTAIAKIMYAITGTTGATFTGLPKGVKGSYTSKVITISGTPIASGTYVYTIILTAGCGTGTAKGSITVKSENTISLSSASGTDSQSVCMNTAMTDISYATAGASSATATGLPVGVTGSFASYTFTVSGTPISSGTYYYTITLGGCGSVTAYGSITVKPESTIGLSSNTGTDSQSVCINTAMTDVTYATTGASSATVTGLPAGVTGSFASNVFTINGTPNASGTFPYTVTFTGDCGTVTAHGSITVKPHNTINLSSASGTDSQSVCINTAITDITYSTTNATGATVTGLPAGVMGIFNTTIYRIIGTPAASGTYNYTVTFTGGCGTLTAKGSISVNPDNTIGLSSASGTDAQSVKVNSAITNIAYATTGASGATVNGLPTGVSGSFAANSVIISGKPSAIGTFPYTVILSGGCGNIITTGSINVGSSGIADQTNKQALLIFPNPSDKEVNIKGTFSSSVQIEITDALGRISQAVYSMDKNIIKLQVSSLESGMYCLRIIESGKVFQSTIIVQH